jgi:von Willebrand factor A domain-containing protein 3
MSADDASDNSLTSLTDNEQELAARFDHSDDDADDEERQHYRQHDNDDSLDFVPFSARGVPPDELQATHINHYHDLAQVPSNIRDYSITRPSQSWLAQNGLVANGLTLKDLLTKGKVSLPTSDKTGRSIQHISFDALIINDFECRLHTTIEMVSNRIRWLLKDSRKVFGVVQGARVLVLMDFSQAQASFGRGNEYHKHLLELIDEQLIHKDQLGFMAYGTDVDPLWKGLREVNSRGLEEVHAWLASLKAAYGCSDENCAHIDSTCPNNNSKCAFKTSGGSNLLKGKHSDTISTNVFHSFSFNRSHTTLVAHVQLRYTSPDCWNSTRSKH